MGSTYIDVTWERMGSEFTYNVFYSINNGPWIRHNDTRLTDEIIDTIRSAPSSYDFPYNKYRIDGLNTDTEYRVKVTCNDKYELVWYSYDNYSSIGGGLFDSSKILTSASGNNLKITFNVDIGSSGFGHGSLGHEPFGGI